MFMRFVELRVQPDRLEAFETFYASRIAPALDEIGGCLYAGLLSNPNHPSECISMTLWDSSEAAKKYEEGGLFSQLVEESEPYLWKSAEWRIRLSDDLTLSYEPVETPPTVEAFPIEVEQGIGDVAHTSANMYVRIVSGRAKPGKVEEVVDLFQREVVPALMNTDGCRYVYLARGLEDEREMLSVTLWDSQSKANEYERHGRFEELMKMAAPLMSSGMQWKMTLEPSRKTMETASDDAHIDGFQVVASETFS